MKAILTLNLGDDCIVIEDDQIANIKDVFKFYSMFSCIPRVGPNNEKELSLCHRTTKDGDDYYSVICEPAGKEFKLRQLKKGSGLFPKSWEPIQRGKYLEGVEQQEEYETRTVVKSPVQPLQHSVHPSPLLAAQAPHFASATKNSDIAVQSEVKLNNYPTAEDLPDTDARQAEAVRIKAQMAAAGIQGNLCKEMAIPFFQGLAGCDSKAATLDQLINANLKLENALTHSFFIEWTGAKWYGSLARKAYLLGLIAAVLHQEGLNILRGITGDAPNTFNPDKQETLLKNLESFLQFATAQAA